MSQRSYFIQPKSGSDWSSSAMVSDQEIMNEFEKMNLPTYCHQTEKCEPMPTTTTDYNVIHRSSNESSEYPGTCSYKTKEPKSLVGDCGGQASTFICSTGRGQTSTGFTNITKMSTPLTCRIVNAQGHPVEINETETINVLGQTGVYANKADTIDWRGQFSLTEYPVNEDPSPEVIHKQVDQKVCLTQEVKVKYFKPPTPSPHGDIVIRQEAGQHALPAPPIVIRQKPPNPECAGSFTVREAPPKPAACEKKVEITIPGKLLPPPPRQVVIERLPQLPAQPQQVTVERWLPFPRQKRRVVFLKEKETACAEKPRNLIIQWEPLESCIKKEFVNLGVVSCNPDEYIERFGSSLVDSFALPEFVKEIPTPSGIELACNTPCQTGFELEGDLEALSLVDNETLERLGLSSYKQSGVYKQIKRGLGFTGYEKTPVHPGKSSKLISEGEFEAYKWPRSPKRKMQTNSDMEQIYVQVFENAKTDSIGRMTVNEAERVLENIILRSNAQCNVNKINKSQFVMSLAENGMVPMKNFEMAVRSLDQ